MKIAIMGSGGIGGYYGARLARAGGKVLMAPETLALIKQGRIAKGDVLGVARVAGIMAAKKTSELVPMCHPLGITSADIYFETNDEENSVGIEAVVTTVGPTGVEMEALTAVAVAALTIYDMCKAVDRAMVVTEVRLDEKRGGKSGVYVRE